MARAATAGELTKFRGDGQATRAYLAVHTPAVVFKARVNQTFISYDSVAQVTFDTVTVGAYTDILPDMTLLVGSSDGGYDVGVCRIRKAATSTILYIGETSEVTWADNLYLTVVNEFAIWPRHVRINGTTALMDYDVTYSDQHASCDPVPNMGSDAVLWLTGATVTYQPSLASVSWVPNSTISAYSWAAPGASATSGLTTATPTLTYNAAGTYRIALTVTAANGKTATGYRFVHVFTDASMPVTQFQVEGASGDYESGNYMLRVVMYGEATRTTIRDRSKVILFARDFYGATEGSIGPWTGLENVIIPAWVAGESIVRNNDAATVTFEAHGPAFWLEKITGFPVGLEDMNFAERGGGTPDDWTGFQDLTISDAIWHLCRWRSTLTVCCDLVQPNLGSAIEAQVAVPTGSLWAQIRSICWDHVLGLAAFDRYGRLFCEIDSQYILSADRSGIPVVMDVEERDVTAEGVTIERVLTAETSMLALSGTVYVGGNNAVATGGKAPGNVFKAYGSADEISNQAFESITQATNKAGLVLANFNNEYPDVSWTFASIMRLADIAPRQYLTMSMSAGDTERGITWTAKKLLPRAIEYQFDPETGAAFTAISCEAETQTENSVRMEFPGSGGGGGGPGGDDDPTDPPQPPDTELPPPPPPAGSGNVVVCTSSEVRRTTDISAGSPTWTDITGAITGVIVDGCTQNDNALLVATETGVWRTDDALAAPPTWTQVYDPTTDIDAGARIQRLVGMATTAYALISVPNSGAADIYVATTRDSGTAWRNTFVYQQTGAVKDYTVDIAETTLTRSGPGLVGADATHTRYDATSTLAPWAMAYTWTRGGGDTIQIGWDYRNSVPMPNDTALHMNQFNTSNSTGALTTYLVRRNSSLSVAERDVLITWLDDYFGVGNWSWDGSITTATGSMPKDASKIYAGFVSGSGSGTASITSVTFWNEPYASVRKSIAMGYRAQAVCLVGGDLGVYISRDAGQHFTLLLTGQIADDIAVIRQQPPGAHQYYIWNDEGQLYMCFDGTALDPVLVTATASMTPMRIIDDPATHRPMYILRCSGGDTYDLVEYFSGVQTVRQSAISGGRSLKMYMGEQGKRNLFWLEDTTIRLSTDRGVTAEDKTGNWATFANGVVVLPLDLGEAS